MPKIYYKYFLSIAGLLLLLISLFGKYFYQDNQKKLYSETAIAVVTGSGGREAIPVFSVSSGLNFNVRKPYIPIQFMAKNNKLVSAHFYYMEKSSLKSFNWLRKRRRQLGSCRTPLPGEKINVYYNPQQVENVTVDRPEQIRLCGYEL